MWTCGEMRRRAWHNLKKYYWMAFLVCFIASILGGSGSGRLSFSSRVPGLSSITNQTESGSFYNDESLELGEIFSDLDQKVNMTVVAGYFMVLAVVFAVAWIVSVAWKTFLGNPICVGSCRFFLESRSLGASAGLGRLFYCFDKTNYLNTIKVMFMRDLFITLWTLLLVIPGIVKSYQYALVPYILSDNPGIDYKKALALSKAMMEGHKFHMFLLYLSFIGWHILGAMCCCVGGFLVIPYVEATIAELYVELRSYPCTDDGLML